MHADSTAAGPVDTRLERIIASPANATAPIALPIRRFRYAADHASGTGVERLYGVDFEDRHLLGATSVSVPTVEHHAGRARCARC
jgi:hypothetical protein